MSDYEFGSSSHIHQVSIWPGFPFWLVLAKWVEVKYSLFCLCKYLKKKLSHDEADNGREWCIHSGLLPVYVSSETAPNAQFRPKTLLQTMSIPQMIRVFPLNGSAHHTVSSETYELAAEFRQYISVCHSLCVPKRIIWLESKAFSKCAILHCAQVHNKFHIFLSVCSLDEIFCGTSCQRLSLQCARLWTIFSVCAIGWSE